MKPLVLCLGSDIRSDDGFGPAVAAWLEAHGSLQAGCDLESVAVAGFALLDLLQGRQRVLIVDAIDSNIMVQWSGHSRGPGALHYLPDCVLAPTHNLVGSHQLTLPVALELGRRMGYDLPECLDVLACEVSDLETMSEQLTPPVAGAVAVAAELVAGWVQHQPNISGADVLSR